MSFKKPFRAKPVVLGEYARAKQARERLVRNYQTALRIVAIAAGVFVAGMIVTNPSAVSLLISHIPSISVSPEARQGIKATKYYRNCDAARAAGAAPIRRGSPGYRLELDEDNDGIACEPYVGL